MRKLLRRPKSITTTTGAAKNHHLKPQHELINLNRQLAKLTRSNQHADALHLFRHHHHHHIKPDHYTLSSTLTACFNLKNLTVGTQLHSLAVKSGLRHHLHVVNNLLSLYAKTHDFVSLKRAFNEIESPDAYSYTTLLSAGTKSGKLCFAFEIFDEMPERNVAVWNAMITGCVESGNEEVAFGLFRDMYCSGVDCDNYSFASVLSSCYGLDFGTHLHSLVIKLGFLSMTSVVNALITMYFNCGNAGDAWSVFKEVDGFVRDQITYNVMIDGLVSMGRFKDGLIMFRELLGTPLKPTELTFVSVMSSCFCVGDGSQFHALVIKMGFEDFTSISNVTMSTYSSCGDLHSAHAVFARLKHKDLVSWNTMISSYAQGSDGVSAFLAYNQMQVDGNRPDKFTFGSLLATSEYIEDVEIVHAVVTRNGLSSNVGVSNALISAYCRRGITERAYHIFCDMISRNLISWNSMISGFLLNGFAMRGLKHAYEMLMLGFVPNEYTLTIIISICSSISALRHGKQVHGYILKSRFTSEHSLCNALVTMYEKCGLLDWSMRVFNSMPEKDVVSWNALISAYAHHGLGKKALHCFKTMQNSSGFKPDQATFSAVLSACSHAGLVDDGTQIFHSMIDEYNVKPGVDHYSCIVGLLGRAGYFDEAERIINSEQFEAHPNIMWTLFGSCVSHGNLSLGRSVARSLLKKEQDNPSVYIMLSNIYTTAGLWEEAANVRFLMDNIGVTKQPGYSWIS